MTIEGRIAIDVSFSDTTSDTGMQALKRLVLTSTDAYSTGKVAIISGTCGTAGVAVAVAPSTYKDAAGSAVSFATVTRFAFASQGTAMCHQVNGNCIVISDGNRVSVSDSRFGGTAGFTVSAYAGTASYTLVILGT